MIEKMKKLLVQYREQLLYLIFGVLTTVVDFAVSSVLYFAWGSAIDQAPILIHLANAIAWAAAVLFAFITNRIWVFRSQNRGMRLVLAELFTFAGGRVLTLLLQELMFVLFFHTLHFNEYVVKIIAAVFVVIANYFISKLLVFRKKK